MKKTIAMIFVLGLLLALLGSCNAQPVPSPSPTAATSSPETPNPSDIGSNTGLARGTWSSAGVYTNKFAKLMFVLPQGWVIASDEELATLMGQAADIFEDEQKWLIESAKLTTIYDTLVRDLGTGNNLIIMYENLSKAAGGTDMTEEDYLEAATKQLATVESTKYTFSKPYDTKIGDVTYVTVRADEENNDYSQYYLMRKQDKYMVGIIVSVFDDTPIENILAQFK